MAKFTVLVETRPFSAFTHEAMDNMSMGIVDQLIDYYQGKRPAHLVNPEVFKRHKK
jgi:hypothetical protein